MSRGWTLRLNQLQKNTRTSLTAATVSLFERRHGDRKLTRLNLAAGQAFVLPYATGKGGCYRLFVQTTYTGSSTIKPAATNNPATAAADVFYGALGVTGTTNGTFAAAGSGTITMNGSTQGGLKGSYIELEDAAVGIWRVGGVVLGSGTVVTPFS